MPLVGRTHGFASIRAAMSRVRGGAAVLVAVTGPPGTGRSAFLDAVADLATEEGFTVRRACGGRPGQESPCVPVGPFPQAGPASGADFPAYLVDDLQWLDKTSLARLTRWFADPCPVPLLTVVTVREGEPCAELPRVQGLLAAADPVIRTAPLGPEEVHALLAELGVLTGAQLAAWTRATGGNPALVVSLLDRVEAVHEVAFEQLLDIARTRPAPWDLRLRVAAVLSSQPEPVRRLACCAAILGGPAEPRVLARLSDLGPAEEAAAARALLRLGWNVERWTPPVLWDCVREIAEDRLTLADRGEMHSRAAELLYEAGSPPDRIVPHLLEVGPGEWTGTARVLREAADDLLRRGDAALAIHCLRRALREFPPDSPERGAFLAALSEAEQDTGVPAMLRHAVQANQLLSSDRERAAVVANVPLTLFLTAPQTAQVLESAGEPAMAGPEAADLGLRLEARTRLHRLGAPGAPAAAVERLRTLTPGPGPGTAAQRELVSVLVYAGILGGRLPAAEAAALVRWMLDHEPASAASVHAAPALMIASGTASGADEPVRGWLDMALEAARGRGDGRLQTRLLGWRALAALHAGRLADAWADASDACAAAPGPLEDDDWSAVVGLTSVALETRDPRLADRLRSLLRERQEAVIPLTGLARRAMRAQSAPEPELPALLSDLLEAAHQAEAAGWCNRTLFPVDLWCVSPLLRVDRPQDALRLLARACEAARASGSPYDLGRILRMWGTVVGGRYALSLLAESVSVLREGSNTLELGRALTAYGNRLRAAGRPGSAELLAEADRFVDAAGESALRCWAGTLRGDPNRALPPGGGALSDTERRVAALVALGHTNQEVAAALGVTRRAVEKTLTRLYQRLGVEGRTRLLPVVRRMAGRAALSSGMLSERL
ncbi:LuxR C-terminal-related transcriptional regulator [Streptomyces sp. NBC_00841]|uniref:LuxR C-terminal-related transcriptional regulator n=1 Tax=Streptomyces sp. NBC_00841 TaxID=2975847 RepID=UPI002DD9DC06|nr:LuxR C-terminal-related transcriptional regulator [Streptomyces sp. NBC_00841]WSA02890.1 LuxR C-terminal-related transcriptional regulator [Streptomyces sp. NBC_00841]